MNKKYTLVILICLITLRLMGIEPPSIQCIGLNQNGICQISWNHPNQYDGISTIDIMVSTSANGPFQLGPTITASDSVCTTQFNIDDLLGSAVEDIYCYLLAHPDAAHSSESDAQSATMHSLTFTLTATGTNPNQNSIARLQWTHPSPFPATCDGQNYSIWRKTSYNADFIRIAQVNHNTNSYQDHVDVCEDSIQYYISIFNYAQNIDPACQFKTRPKGKVFSDGTAPDVPILDSVSVDPVTQLIELGWTQNSPDAIGCVIYEVDDPNPGNNPIDTVIGTHWTSTDQGNTLHRYTIAAIDSCFYNSKTTNAGEISTPQNNMVVTVASMDVCRKIIKLQWNPYVNMTGSIGEYRVYYAQDNGNMQYLATVNGTSYECNGLPTNHQYKFMVKAVNANGNITASSCLCTVTNYTEEETNDFCYIRHVSVIDNKYVEIQVLTNGANTPFTELYIYRSINNNLNFNKIATVSYRNGVSNYSYEDHDADITGNLNYYFVSLRNECGAESAASNIAHTILLKGEGTAAQENALQWNNYGEFNGGTESYSIYRKLEISPSFVDVENGLPSSELNNYNDNVSDLFEMGSHFQYYVVAKEGLNEYGFADESMSNIIEVEQFPNTYIPNAFYPNSTILENKIFKPANSFMGTKGYWFTVFSRQGEIVFITNDITKGWDGTEQKSGKQAPAGMYVYRLEYLKPDGETVVKNGTVMLIY